MPVLALFFLPDDGFVGFARVRQSNGATIEENGIGGQYFADQLTSIRFAFGTNDERE